MLTLVFPHFALHVLWDRVDHWRSLLVDFFLGRPIHPPNIFVKYGWGLDHYVHSVGKPFLLATWGVENPQCPLCGIKATHGSDTVSTADKNGRFLQSRDGIRILLCAKFPENTHQMNSIQGNKKRP